MPRRRPTLATSTRIPRPSRDECPAPPARSHAVQQRPWVQHKGHEPQRQQPPFESGDGGLAVIGFRPEAGGPCDQRQSKPHKAGSGHPGAERHRHGACQPQPPQHGQHHHACGQGNRHHVARSEQRDGPQRRARRHRPPSPRPLGQTQHRQQANQNGRRCRRGGPWDQPGFQPRHRPQAGHQERRGTDSASKPDPRQKPDRQSRAGDLADQQARQIGQQKPIVCRDPSQPGRHQRIARRIPMLPSPQIEGLPGLRCPQIQPLVVPIAPPAGLLHRGQAGIDRMGRQEHHHQNQAQRGHGQIATDH